MSPSVTSQLQAGDLSRPFLGWAQIGPQAYRAGTRRWSVVVQCLGDCWGYLLFADDDTHVTGGEYCFHWDSLTARDAALRALQVEQIAQALETREDPS